MDDPFLIGNEYIDRALEAVNAAGGEAALEELFRVLRQRMQEDGHLLLPVDYPDPEDPHTFSLRGFDEADGTFWLACFTGQEELNRGEPVGILSYFIDLFFQTVVDHDGLEGVILNPFGHPCRLTKDMLRSILNT